MTPITKRYLFIACRESLPEIDIPLYTIEDCDSLEEARSRAGEMPNYVTSISILDMKEGLYKDHWFPRRGWIGNFYDNLVKKGIL